MVDPALKTPVMTS